MQCAAPRQQPPGVVDGGEGGVLRSPAPALVVATPVQPWYGLPLAALGLPLVVYLPNHYSATLGLSVSAVGVGGLSSRERLDVVRTVSAEP